MKTVFAIHTAMPMVEPTKELFAQYLPDVRLVNVVDESLIQDVIAANEVPPMVKKRLMNYYYAALDAGADVIFNTCSSVGDVALLAKELMPVPLVKIDDAMAEKAVVNYKRIGVLATLETTLSPTVRLIKHFAQAALKTVTIVDQLAEGAFEAVISGDKDKHDKLILDAAIKIADKVDVLVLAQGSMARMEEELKLKTGKEVLSSPLSGVLSVKEVVQHL